MTSLSPSEAAVEIAEALHFKREVGPKLIEALRAAAGWMYDRDNDPIDEFERVAARFQSETGMLRPGKDDRIGAHGPDERREAFELWCEKTHREVLAAARAALLLAGVKP